MIEIISKQKADSLIYKEHYYRQYAHKFDNIDRFRGAFYLSSLFHFCKEFCGFDKLDDVHHWNLCKDLQASVTRDDNKDRFHAIGEARESFKTTVFSHGLPSWCLVRDPEDRIIGQSSTEGLAKDNLKVVKAILESKDVAKIYPYMLDENGRVFSQRDKFSFNLAVASDKIKESSMEAMGITSSITGRHPKKIFADDIFERLNSKTNSKREETRNAVEETIINVLRDRGVYLMLFTRWHLYDQINTIRTDPLYTGDFAFNIRENGIVDCKPPFSGYKYNEEQLRHIKKTNPVLYALQYELKPRAMEDGDIEIKDHIKYWGKSEFMGKRLEYKDKPLNSINYMLIDPATGEAKDRKKYSGIIIAHSTPKRRLLIRKAFEFDLKIFDLIKRIYDLAEEFNIYKVGIGRKRFEWMKTMMEQYEKANDITHRPRIKMIEEKSFGTLTQMDDVSAKERRFNAVVVPMYQSGLVYHHCELNTSQFEKRIKSYPDIGSSEWDMLDALALITQMYDVPASSEEFENEKVTDPLVVMMRKTQQGIMDNMTKEKEGRDGGTTIFDRGGDNSYFGY